MSFLMVVVVVVLAYYLFVRPLTYWSSRGVPQGWPIPLFGDNWQQLIRSKSFAEVVKYLYDMYPNLGYSGTYQFMTPFLQLRDPDLIKKVTVTDFEHFVDHIPFFPEDTDPLWGKNLFSLNGQKWKDMRSTLTPSFTTSKMRTMFVLMTEVSEQFVQHFLRKNEDIITMEMKNCFTRFTNDVIASTAFGVHVDSLEKPDNNFFRMGKSATDFSNFWMNIKMYGYLLIPNLMKFFKIKFYSQEVRDFFLNLIKETIKVREKQNIVRPDMLNLLMEARKHGFKYDDHQETHDAGLETVEEVDLVSKNYEKKMDLTDEGITAQALLLFFGGFESVSSLMCFTSYELAVNPDIQEKLIEEIDEIRMKHGEKLKYDTLLEMKYMDMVISESLRKWPAASIMNRICTKQYVLESPKFNQKPLKIEKDIAITIPIYAIHRDAKYYPEPERFDPQRFNNDNKPKIKPYTYIPFGLGPRNCIGYRFALLETKALFFYILSNFEIVPVKKTPIPLKLYKKSFNMAAEGGFWLGLKRRSK